MTQVVTASETRYIIGIDAVDADTDRLTISTVQAGQTAQPGAMPQLYSFNVAKPHSYATGGELTFTTTVSTTS